MIGLVRLTLWAVTLLFVPGVLSQFEAPKAMVVRVVGVAAIAYVAAGARRMGDRRAWAPLDWAMVAWLASEIVSSLASVSPRISLLGDEAQHEGLLTSLGLAGVYVATRLAARTRPTAEPARAILDAALAAIAVACGYAVLQFLGWDPLFWRDTATFGGSDATVFVRPFGTLGHPNVLGGLAAVALCGSLALALAGTRRAWGYALASVLYAAVILMTLSRAAWIASLAGIAFVLVAGGASGAVSRRRAGVALVATAAIAIVAVTIGPLAPMFRQRLLELASPSQGSAGARGEIWRSALAMWRDRPWTGQGPDTFGLVFPRFQTLENWKIEWATAYVHAHSAPLDQLATRGVLGALAALAWLGALGVAVWRAMTQSQPTRGLALAAAAGLVALLVSGLFGAPGLAAAALGVTLAAALAALSSPGHESPAVVRASEGSRVAAIAAALVVASVCLLDLAASRALVSAEEWLPRVPGEVASRTAASVQRAMALDPVDDMVAHHACATLLEADVRSDPPGAWLDQAERAARRGIALEPRRAVGYQELGTVLLRRAALGDTSSLEPAVRAYDAAVARAPMNALAMLEAAHGLLDRGRPDLAAPYAERAAALYPDQTIVQATLDRVMAARRSSPAR